MSKQTSRRVSKQGQTTNKQPGNQSAKQTSPANTDKQAANVSAKQDRPENKQTTNVPVKQNRPADKLPTRQAMKQERREEERQRRLGEQRRAIRRKRFFLIGLVAAVILVAAVAVYAFANAHNSTTRGQAAPTEQVFNSAYQPVDGVYCDQLEQLSYHIHVHLTIWINGSKVTVPQGVGIASDGSCFYWLHTHDSTGVVHIEAPTPTALTLGNFLNIWGQRFPQLGYQDQLASSTGWTIYVNGQKVTGDFNKIAFQPHMLITLAYNSPGVQPDTVYSWTPGL
jgi:hypothetical protein